MTTSEKVAYRLNTLCEVCTKACGGCSWSKKNVQQPVEGWDAIRHDLQQPKKFYAESYIVLHCPEFELEKHNEWAYKKFDPEKVRQQVEHRDKLGAIRTEQMAEKRALRAKLLTGG